MEENNPKTVESGDGALVGALVVIALIVVGGAYLIQTKIGEIREQNATANALHNGWDDLSSIQTDLDKNSGIEEIGQDLK